MKRRAALWGVVVLSVALTPSAHAGKKQRSHQGSLGTNAKPTRVIIKFRPGAAANERAALHRSHGHQLDRIIPQLDLHAVRVPRGKTAQDVMDRYKNHPLVEFVEEEIFMEPAATPNDPWFKNWQIPLQLLSAEAAWEIGTGAPDIPIAVLDTGLDINHYEFVDRIARGEIYGYDFADDDPDFNDPHGHGTLVAGVIGATTNNGLGIAGATWVNPIMVLRSAFGFDAREAVVWATDNGARVISMSFGSYISSASWEITSRYAFDHGVVLVGAAGNDGVEWAFYPAAYPTVLAVTGVNADGEPGPYNWGDWIDLSAPGGGVLTTYPIALDPDGLGFSGGTSISAPFVSAAAGLVLSVDPTLSPACVMDILRSTADDLSDPGFDVMTGYGRVNFHAAVLAAQNWECLTETDTTAPTARIVSPAAGDMLSGMVTVLVVATDDTRVTQVDLYSDTSFISSDTVAPHEWAFDTTEFPDGEHVLWAVAHDAAGNTGESARVTVFIDNSAPCDCPLDCSAPASSELPGSTCDDGLDNDCDGLMDCADPDCNADPVCEVPTCDNDGVCELGEDCNNCPNDCFLGEGASCGNGICEASNGEDCVTCPTDCNGKQGGKPSGRFCCGGGGGVNPVGCDDNRCNDGEFTCTERFVADSCCGDGVCTGAESACSCPVDCGPPTSREVIGSTCRDGLDNDCDGNADCDDRDCADDQFCPSCDNDGVCEPGEDCRNCPKDCSSESRGRRRSRYCCGNGVLEDAEGDGGICDGNP